MGATKLPRQAVRRLRGQARDAQLEVSPEFERARGSAALFAMVVLPLGTFTALILLEAELSFKLFMACLFASVLLFFLALYLPIRGARRGLVRVADTGPLRFASPAAFGLIVWSMLLIAVAGLTATLDQLTGSATIPQGAGMLRFSGPVLLVAGLLGLGGVVRATRKPTGLVLNREGILGEGPLVSTIRVPWNDLEIVELGTEKKTRVVRLYDGHGEMHVLKPILLGSDPVIIAEIIEYYRSHPGDRGHLDDPPAALALVGDFTAA